MARATKAPTSTIRWRWGAPPAAVLIEYGQAGLRIELELTRVSRLGDREQHKAVLAHRAEGEVLPQQVERIERGEWNVVQQPGEFVTALPVDKDHSQIWKLGLDAG